MRRNRLIIPLVVVIACVAVVVVLSTGVFGTSGSGSHSSTEQSADSPACLPATIQHSASLPGTDVDVSPAPETDTANPHTQISFLGVPVAQIHAVSVVGQHSGEHPGQLHAYSQGDGASFVPDSPFDAGERVTVHAVIGGAGSRAGSAAAGGGRPIAYQFRVDTPYPTANVSEFPNPAAAAADYESFATMPGMQAPIMTVTVPDRDPAAGDILTTNGPGPGQYGPLIYTPQGRLVWFEQLSGGETAEDLNEQTYEGERDLTWWRGRVLSLGFGQGEDVVMNSHYQILARVPGGNGLHADLHDFQIAGNGIAYITAFNPIRCNLSSVHGARDGAIIDTAVQEIDMKTGLVRWEWHSLDHVGVEESETEAPSSTTPWDWFHINSIDPESDGDILISARSTWAGYQLEGGTGKILWRLGGLKSSFKMGPGTETAWQHDGRMLANGDVTFFDDGSNPPIHSQSRAIQIALDFATHEARLVSAYTHPDPPLLAASQGNMQTLAGGDTVVGYGAVPQITEFAGGSGDIGAGLSSGGGGGGSGGSDGSDGSNNDSLLFDAHLPLDMTFYRAFRYPWSARPATPPAVLANLNSTGEETIVHASWNGATGIASWRVLAGEHPDSLRPQATIAATGFETSTILPKKYPYAAVQALDSAGAAIGVSHTTQTIRYAASLPSAGRSG